MSENEAPENNGEGPDDNSTVPLGLKQRLPRQRLRLKVLGLVVVCLVLLVGVAFGTDFLMRRDTSKNPAPATEQQSSKPLTPKQQVERLAYEGKYEEAQQMLAQQLGSAKTTSEKSYIRTQQATLALNAQKYDEAMGYAQALDELQPTDASASLLAQVAAAKGDKVAAKNYLQVAIARLNKSAPTYDLKVQEYQMRIAALDQ